MSHAILKNDLVEQARQIMSRLKKLSELAKDEAEQKWLVEDLLNIGGLSLLVADPKVGKSQLSRHLIVGALFNSQFLGKDILGGNTVIYLALEDIPRELKNYLNSMGVTDDCRNLLIGDRSWCSENNIEQLRVDIRENKATLCVIDTFVAFSDLLDLNEYTQVYKLMQKLSNIARDENCHILFVHHKNKGDGVGAKSIMGSQAFFGGVDTCFILSGENEEKILEVKPRYTSKSTIKFKMSPTTISDIDFVNSNLSCEDFLLKKVKESPTGFEFRSLVGYGNQNKQSAKKSLIDKGLIYEVGGESGNPLKLFSK